MPLTQDQKRIVQDLLQQVNQAAQSLVEGDDDAGQILSSAASALSAATQDPSEALTKFGSRPLQNAAFKICIDLGVFNHLPEDGTGVEATKLAERLNCDKDLLVRLMRSLVPIGVFTDHGNGFYGHGAISRAAANPAKAAMFELIFNGLHVTTATPRYFQITKYGKDPSASEYNSAWQYGNSTTKTFFEFLQSQPELLANFNKAMPEFSAQYNPIGKAYPFSEVLQGCKQDDIAIVDIGGGNGSVLRSIRETNPGVQGRMIVQDLVHMFAQGDKEKQDIEFMKHDFFTPQPIRGAPIYLLSHVLHDWPDEKCLTILKHIGAAMTNGMGRDSRLVISEAVLPDSNPGELETLMDLTLLVVDGIERSKLQWETLLQKAGFKQVQISTQGKSSVIEARL